jgi:outer membrane protein assembly factor BamB
MGGLQLGSSYGAHTALLETDNDQLLSVRLSDGKTVSHSSAHIFTNGVGPSSLSADRVLLLTKHTLNLYDNDNLSKPLWNKGITEPKQVLGSGDNRLFTVSATYSLTSGQKQSWSGALASDIAYSPTEAIWPDDGSRLLRYEGDSDGGTLDRVNSDNGSSLWHLTIANPQSGMSYDRDGVLIVRDGVLTKYNGKTGKKVWSKSGYSQVTSLRQSRPNGVGSEDLDLAFSNSSGGDAVALDTETGERLFDVLIGGSNDSDPIGAGSHVLYLTRTTASGDML